jgi:hypothetical protein
VASLPFRSARDGDAPRRDGDGREKSLGTGNK